MADEKSNQVAPQYAHYAQGPTTSYPPQPGVTPYPPPAQTTSDSTPSYPPATGVGGTSSYPQPGDSDAAPSYPQEPPPRYEPPQGQQTGPAPNTAQHPQQQYSAYPAGGGRTTTTTTYSTVPSAQVVIAMPGGYRQHPQQLQCPACNAQVTTTTNHKNGGMVWLIAGVICLFGGWLGCCLIPLCINDLKDVEHNCPNCNAHLGTYSRL